MAKESQSVSAKGVLDMSDGTITEINSKGEITAIVRIIDALEKFEGETISFSVRKEVSIGSVV